MIKGYLTGKVTRIQEGASYEDIEYGDAYETVYLVYSPEGELIWDTTCFKMVEQYFDEIHRDLKEVEEILQLVKERADCISYSEGCDQYGDHFSISYYDDGQSWIIYDTHNIDMHRQDIKTLINAIKYAWTLLSTEDEECEYIPHACSGDYSPSCPWLAPGMSIHDFF